MESFFCLPFSVFKTECEPTIYVRLGPRKYRSLASRSFTTSHKPSHRGGTFTYKQLGSVTPDHHSVPNNSECTSYGNLRPRGAARRRPTTRVTEEGHSPSYGWEGSQLSGILSHNNCGCFRVQETPNLIMFLIFVFICLFSLRSSDLSASISLCFYP